MSEKYQRRTKLRERRERLGMTQEDVAYCAAISRTHYANYERGRDDVSRKTRDGINAAFEAKKREMIKALQEEIGRLEELQPLTFEEMEHAEE